MQILNDIIVPSLKIIVLGGLMGWCSYMVIRGFHNAWTKAWKFVWKYKIRKKAYPEKITEWVFSCIDAGIGWYDAKKLMMVGMTPTKTMNETLWIYDQIAIELNKQKGGIKKHGRQFERSYSKEIGKFPNLTDINTNTDSTKG